jgi:hypothetical protein
MAALPRWSLPLGVVPGGDRLLAPRARLELTLRPVTALALQGVGVLDASAVRVGWGGRLTA